MKTLSRLSKKVIKTAIVTPEDQRGDENGEFAINFAKKICNFQICMLYCMGNKVII